ncbi:hypothetical protein, partial [Burkholderia sp.]|uniref:hypothetical protein n=1 Tax=Burkholderia sp. TaxID=36773 RepID=UPI002589A8B1
MSGRQLRLPARKKPASRFPARPLSNPTGFDRIDMPKQCESFDRITFSAAPATPPRATARAHIALRFHAT